MIFGQPLGNWLALIAFALLPIALMLGLVHVLVEELWKLRPRG